jgi:hypothetical protein
VDDSTAWVKGKQETGRDNRSDPLGRRKSASEL